MSQAIDEQPLLIATRVHRGWELQGPGSHVLGNRQAAQWDDSLPSAGWTVENGRITVRSDRHGMVPLYYYEGERGFGVAGSWVALQRRFELKRLHDDAIACYLHLGHYLAEDTPIVGIRRMPPDARLDWEDGVARLELAPPIQLPRLEISRNDALAEYGQLFFEAIRSLAGSASLDPLVLISGGQDSRHILLALLEAGISPRTCLTQAPPERGPEDDSVVARRLCSELGLTLEIIPAGSQSLQAEREKNQLLGMDSAYHVWLLPLMRTLDALPRGLVLDGLGGDVLSASRFLTDGWIEKFEAGRLRDAASVYMGPDAHLRALLRPEWARRWSRERVADRLETELRRYAHYPNPQAMFQLRNRTRRAIAPSLWTLFARRHDVALPYLHSPLFDFLSSLPMRMLVGRRFHREAIELRYPQVSRLPFSKVGDRPASRTMAWPPMHARDALSLALSPDVLRFVRPSYLGLRAVRGAVWPRYAENLPAISRPTAYLAQLARLLGRS